MPKPKAESRLHPLIRGWGLALPLDVYNNIGALIIRIGFGAHYIIVIIRSRQNGIGNDLGPYIIFMRGLLAMPMIRPRQWLECLLCRNSSILLGGSARQHAATIEA